MKYLFLIYSPESAWTEEERSACMVKSHGICDELAAAGKYITAAPLESVTTASTVRKQAGKPLVTAGPFAETTEQLGGFYLLDLANLDEAIAVASRLPPTVKGTVEIRPILELDGLPPSREIPLGGSDPAGEPYLLLSYDDEVAWKNLGDAELRAAMAEAVGITHELHAQGRYLGASPLHPTSTATSVRTRDGKRIVTDGPFAETHEVLGGFYLILAKSQEDALEIAARHPGLRFGSVEVRQVFDLSRVLA